MKKFNQKKELANSLAIKLASEDGAIALSLMQKLNQASKVASNKPGKPNKRTDVGIWKRKDAGGFERCQGAFNEWRCWADLEFIPPKSNKKRIVLVGESAARGYLYDPLINPAKILQNTLNQLTEEFEVIDMARIDINQFEITELISEIAVLEPNHIILWCGNNWLNFSEYSSEDKDYLLSQKNFFYQASHDLFLNHKLPNRTRKILEKLQSICANSQVIIPEFNIVNWVNEPGVEVPILDLDRDKWLDLRTQAEELLELGNYKQCRSLAIEMSQIDS